MTLAQAKVSRKDVLGVLLFKGSVCSFAYLNSKEPISQAVADIKRDIISSLQSRLGIICDEAYGDISQTEDVSQEASDGISTDKPVARMLVGGMKVIGIYIWVGDTVFKNSTITLCQLLQTVKGVAEAAPLLDNDREERLLIHICYSPMRWTCRNCTWTSNITSSSLRPCDFKMGRVLTSLQTFKCNYNFNLRLPICQESASNTQTLSDVLHQGISHHAKELKDARPIIDGNLVVSDEPSTSDGVHEVELLLPFMKDTYAEARSRKDVLGVLLFKGSVCSFAYLNSKEPISQAVADIKVFNNQKECSLSFPRRVFVPWLAGTYICDYLQPSETLEVLKDHCVELMSMEAPSDSSTILEPEKETPLLVTKPFWDVAIPFNSASCSPLEKKWN
nr:protein odr-4 like [Quercus suber]